LVLPARAEAWPAASGYMRRGEYNRCDPDHKKSSRHTQYQVSDFTLFCSGSGKDSIRFGAGFARPELNEKLGASFKAYYRDILKGG
jgi:hypothetical protein